MRTAAAILVALTVSHTLAAGQSAPACVEPAACVRLALDARDRGAYETFHDLAWRAVQTGPANDAELMYLLARAQALSGRRRDALVMLRRLAERGAAADALVDDDFRRVRELEGWGLVAALIAERAKRPEPSAAAVAAPLPPPPVATPAALAAPPAVAAPAVAAPSVAAPPPVAPPPTSPRASPPPVSPAPAVAAALAVEPATAADFVRFETPAFSAAGVAYDAVSRRVLLGDSTGRRLFVVGEGSTRPIDLARAATAQFQDVRGFAIDAARGTLWVATTATAGETAALHRLQLISGREVATIAVRPDSGSVQLADVAVAADGAVVVLDAAAPRLLRLVPGETAARAVMPLARTAPVSLALRETGRIAYIAHAEGVSRLDLQSRAERTMSAPEGVRLEGFRWIRWHDGALVGAQRQADGAWAIVRLRLSANGLAVTGASIIDAPHPSAIPAAGAVSGSHLYYVEIPESTPAPDREGIANITVRRIQLTGRP